MLAAIVVMSTVGTISGVFMKITIAVVGKLFNVFIVAIVI